MNKRLCFSGFGDAEIQALAPAFAQINRAWDCVFCPDSAAVRELLAQGPCAALVTDLRFDEAVGSDLLEWVAASYPHTLRFVLGSVADRELVVNSIGAPFQFISRPWKLPDLISTVERSLSLEAWLSNDKLRAFIPQLGRLPSIPSTYFEVLKKAESPNASIESIGDLVSRDPALTARLLQTVNSAGSGLTEKVMRPMDAVSMLGLETVKALVLCLQVFAQPAGTEESSLSLEALWQHSFAVGNLARQLALNQTDDPGLAEAAFTAGLLHCVGQIVLATNLAKRYASVLKVAQEEGVSLAEIELTQFGVTSSQVGAYLLGLWGMPLAIIESTALYQAPGSSNDREFSVLTAVHVANVLVSEEHELFRGLRRPEFDRAYLERLKLPAKRKAWQSVLMKTEAKPNEVPREQNTTARISPSTGSASSPRFGNSGQLRKVAIFALPVLAVAAAAIGAIKFSASAPKTPESPVLRTAENRPSPAGFDGIKIQGIFYREGQSAAIINGKTLAPGQGVDGVTVVSIKQTNVVLESAGQQKTFQIKPPSP